MVDYSSYRTTVGHVHTVVETMLQKIAFQQFEQDRGTAVHAVLPDRSESYTFESHGFEGYVDPDRRTLENSRYKDTGITVNRLAATPSEFSEIAAALEEAWWDTFGEEYEMANQPDHPGKPQMESDQLDTAVTELIDQHDILVADPTLDDLVGAVEDKNYQLAAQFLNVDDWQALFVPGGGHELTALFMNGQIHVVYKDSEIALLKPEYDHETREEVLNQMRPVWQEVRITGVVPEEAFVVGVDDTPTGLFAHSIDGTHLDPEQEVKRSYIHDVMGFDRNYEHETEILSMDEGERVRLQGDFAVEYLGDTDCDSATRCNLPIDNHLSIINHASIPEGETRSQEPVTVDVPRLSTLNVVHDEHDNVTVDLPEGRYRFYLLQRGLQLEEDRPRWSEGAEKEGT